MAQKCQIPFWNGLFRHDQRYAFFMDSPEQAQELLSDVFRKIMPLAEVERKTILGTMVAVRGNRTRACKLLAIGKTTLYRKLAEYDYPACLSS